MLQMSSDRNCAGSMPPLLLLKTLLTLTLLVLVLEPRALDPLGSLSPSTSHTSVSSLTPIPLTHTLASRKPHARKKKKEERKQSVTHSLRLSVVKERKRNAPSD